MNPYPARFLDLYRELGAGGIAVDLGCGPARPETAELTALVNVDLVPGADLPRAVQGDVGRVGGVPANGGTFDLALSAAVLEHVPYPLDHLREAHRLLRGGGLLYVDGASMQPLHRVPGHYFGVYPDGLRLLLEEAGFEVVEQWSWGSLADMVPWIRQLCGEAGGDDAWAAIEGALREVYEATPNAAEVLATGSAAIARKPVVLA